MAGRIRTLKPEIFEDEKTGTLDDWTFRLFVGLICAADDYGNERGAPAAVRAFVFPYDPSTTTDRILNGLAELSERDLITCYTCRGQEYIHLQGWEKHQRVSHPGKPRCPFPSDENSRVREILRRSSGDPPETLARSSEILVPDPDPDPDHRSPHAGSGKARSPALPGVCVSDLELEQAYATYPRKEGKKDGLRIAKKEIQTADQLAQLRAAIAKYSGLVRGRPADKVKHFSSFMSNWRDYAPAPVAESSRPTQRQLAMGSSAPIERDPDPPPNMNWLPLEDIPGDDLGDMDKC